MHGPTMSDDMESLVEERLSVFDDEPDLNDWVEVMCGAAMVVLGVFHLVEPGELVDANIMRWFSAAIVAAGAVWAGHGLKDMAVKEVRRSIALLDMAEGSNGVDTGLIRDVLMHQEAYRDFLVHAYDSAWKDGVITDEELRELKSFQKALGISDEAAADINVKAAIKSAAADGEITASEAKSIDEAARAANMTPEQVNEALSSELEKQGSN
jgi:tellurite resistance protein